jgi:hypothetical protein
MVLTHSAVKIPTSNDVVLLVVIFLSPHHFGGGGSQNSTLIISSNPQISQDFMANYFYLTGM